MFIRLRFHVLFAKQIPRPGGTRAARAPGLSEPQGTHIPLMPDGDLNVRCDSALDPVAIRL